MIAVFLEYFVSFRNHPIWAPLLAALPLSISTFPWGVLCGTLALNAGYSPLQAQALSLLVFAGAAQLSAISIVGAGGSALNLFSSVAVISSRHLLYSAKFHAYVHDLSLIKRVAVAFVLTDELFVISETHTRKTGKFDLQFALIAGFSFYMWWNLATLLGILVGERLSGLTHIGLDFAIGATFIAMVMPSIQNFAVLIAVICSGVSAWYFTTIQLTNGMLWAGMLGMAVGFVILTWQNRQQ